MKEVAIGVKCQNIRNFFKGLKVCVASAWYPHANNPYHCIFVHDFAKRIRRAGAKVFVFTIIHSREDKKFEMWDNIPVLRVKVNTILSFFNPFKFLSFFKVFNKADLIHVHAIDVFGAFSILIAKLIRKPVVVTVHRADVLPSNSLFLNILRIIAFKVVDAIIAVSKATKKLALNVGAPANKITVIYNAVDETMFTPRSKSLCRQKLGLPQNSKIILFVGNLIPRKGVEYLIRALPIILTKIPNVLLVVIGDGPQRNELEHLAKELNLEQNIVFTGRISTEKLCLYYGAADIFVLPSLHEGHPMVLLEAMASGLPVVATKVSGNMETVIHGKNGYLVEPKNAHQLANAIIKILSERKQISKFGKASLMIYRKKFSEEKQICKIAEIYSRILRSKF
ncbi:MAG: hypothetical protein DRO40_04330 [Thermoprotei archaeon]|nr:MAG: hypothetical protein DRO40_04330 [Thermoprotei archaeon]